MTTMIGYLRVSTDEQASSGLGLAAQRDTITTYAAAHGWDVDWYVDEGVSAKTLNRPQLLAALARLGARHPDVAGLVVAKLDRLSRSVADFADVLALSRTRGWSLVAIDLGVDTSTPVGELIANVMMSVAQWERRIIGERTSAAMHAAARRGQHLGRRSSLPATTVTRLLALQADDARPARIAARLNEEGVPAAMGGPWHPATVSKTLARLTRTTHTPKEV